MPNRKIYLVLDNVRSRENVGAIFRTSDAAGISKIYLCGITPIPPHPKISKTALGAEKWIPWEYHKQTWRLLESLKRDKINVVALESAAREHPVRSFSGIPAMPSEVVGRFASLRSDRAKTASESAHRIFPHGVSIFKFKPRSPLALVVGNEIKGLSPRILKYCDKVVSIPMIGRKESLNVAVAAGIVIYQLYAASS